MLACLWLACGLFPSIPALRRDIQANSVILAHDAQPAVENITLFPEHFTYKAVPETGQSQSNRKNGQKWPPALLLANFGTKVEMDRSATSETARYMGLWKIQAQSRNQENEWDAWYLPKCVSNSEVNLVKPKRWESHDGCEKVSRHKACPTGYAIVCKQYNVFGKMINLMCCCPQDNLFYKQRRRGGNERHARKCLAGEEPGSKDGKSFILQSEGGSQKALTSLADTIKTDFASRAVLAQVTRSQHIPNPAADPTLLASTSAAACGQGLRSTLSSADESTAILRIWPDADLAGDPLEDTHSSGGSWIEIARADGSWSWPIHWSYNKQGFTAGHTQEAETASLYDTLRADGMPLASLVEFLLGREVLIEVMEDNEATIAAIRKGYAPKMRHLHRIKRIHLGYLSEQFSGDEPRAVLIKASSKDQKGDILTKEMAGPRFNECKGMLNIIPIASCLREVQGRWLVCKDGNALPIAEGLVQVALACAPAKAVDPGVDSWIVDTGSGQHLVSESNLDGMENVRKVDTPIRLSTANGIIESDRRVRVYVHALGIWIDAWVLKATPLVLSADKLAEIGYDLNLRCAKKQRTATLKRGERSVKLSMIKGVPVLDAT